jgi:hypothetical protein
LDLRSSVSRQNDNNFGVNYYIFCGSGYTSGPKNVPGMSADGVEYLNTVCWIEAKNVNGGPKRYEARISTTGTGHKQSFCFLSDLNFCFQSYKPKGDTKKGAFQTVLKRPY